MEQTKRKFLEQDINGLKVKTYQISYKDHAKAMGRVSSVMAHWLNVVNNEVLNQIAKEKLEDPEVKKRIVKGKKNGMGYTQQDQKYVEKLLAEMLKSELKEGAVLEQAWSALNYYLKEEDLDYFLHLFLNNSYVVSTSGEEVQFNESMAENYLSDVNTYTRFIVDNLRFNYGDYFLSLGGEWSKKMLEEAVTKRKESFQKLTS